MLLLNVKNRLAKLTNGRVLLKLAAIAFASWAKRGVQRRSLPSLLYYENQREGSSITQSLD